MATEYVVHFQQTSVARQLHCHLSSGNIQRTKILTTENTCHKTKHHDIKLLNVVDTENDK